MPMEHIADFLSNVLQSGSRSFCLGRCDWWHYDGGIPEGVPSIATEADLARRHLQSAQARESAVRKLSLHRVK